MAATQYAQNHAGRQRKDGVQDRHAYLQSARANAARGQDLPQSKLLDIDVIDIRSAHRQRLKLLQYIRDNLSNAALAKRHNTAESNIEKIVTYQSWGHIA